tara:strand:- start:185 stop:511 length:327 start_codon:yes stop_codon:yes gene_type:complete
MKKTVIDLNNKQLHLNELTGGITTSFAYKVQDMLLDLYHAGFDLPLTIKGTQKQIETFFRALQNEKRYMDAYMKHGLGDTRTMMNKSDLSRSVASFERETGLRWPFKN